MILTITLIITFLVLVNFLLLKFSCDKTVKPSKANKKPVILKPEITIVEISERIAPTGS